MLAAILDFAEETEKKNHQLDSQYAYCKYFEIIQAGVYSYITKFWW